jgi:hypothetical protein
MDSFFAGGTTSLDKYLHSKVDTFFSGLEDKMMNWLTTSFVAFRTEISAKIAEQSAKIDTLRSDTHQVVNTLKHELNQKEIYISGLTEVIVGQKRATLEQGVHDRKRDIMVGNIKVDTDETPAKLELKVRENFINTLNIPKRDVDSYVFTARHRLQNNGRGKAPNVICVLVDLDHVNQVLTAARKKGKEGQHIQSHLPRELQKWKHHCLYQRRLLINAGKDPKDVRVRDRRGFSVLQIKEGREYYDKLTYEVTLHDNTQFPVVIAIPQPGDYQ